MSANVGALGLTAMRSLSAESKALPKVNFQMLLLKIKLFICQVTCVCRCTST